MKEQVELDFVIKGEVDTIRDLVDILNDNHLVEILTVTDGSEPRKLSGPVFLSVALYSQTSPDRWEYKLASPGYMATHLKIQEWLNELGAEGWEVMEKPEDAGHRWFFKRRI